jgi:hypothetical protein
MKKTLLSIFSLATTISFGQLFTSANEYQIGSSQTMYMCDSAAPTFDAVTGTGVTWDYSTYLKVNNPNRIYEIIENTNPDFPGSTKVASVQSFFDTYVISSGTTKDIEGFKFTDPGLAAVLSKAVFSDDIHVFDYDVALDEEFTDNHAGVLTGSAVSPLNNTCSGTSTSKFDAIGTLILSPTVTKTNVQRHKLDVNLNGTSILGPILMNITQYEYYDYSSSDLPLLSMTSLKVYLNNSPTPTVKMKFLLNSEDPIQFVTGLNSNENEKFAVYPNPSSSEITISSPNFDGSEKIAVLDLAGKTVLSSSEATINISDLKSGVYFVEVEKEGVKSQVKFIKN